VDRRLIGTTPKLVCEGAWKLFGPDAEGFLAARGGTATLDDIRTAGLVPAVRNVDLTVRAGESFVVMGLSGCGKSTLVRCMSRIADLTAGRVLLDGRDLGTMSREELVDLRRHKMGMVFQHFALLPHLTVLENVAFPLRIQGRPAAERDARARELVELVGLSGRELHFPRQLSGGQQQRVGIARSLAVNPEVWFLDEPFSALDPLIRSEMQDEFLRLRDMFSTTIVFITHDLDEAVRLAEHLIANGSEGLVVHGTTGEASTLTDDEKLALTEAVAGAVGTRVPVISGTGSNDTAHSAHLTKQAARFAGVAGFLAVTPYYNKPPIAGIEAHTPAPSPTQRAISRLCSTTSRSAWSCICRLPTSIGWLASTR